MNADLEHWLRTEGRRTLVGPAAAADDGGLFERLRFVAELLREAPPDGEGPRLLYREAPADPHAPMAASPVRSAVIGYDGLTVGREAADGLRLADVKLSGRHFHIRRDGRDCVLEDLHSRNGTYVNGRRIEARILCDGDILQAGAQVLVYVARSSG